MKKIALIELFHHHEVLINLYKILDKDAFQIKVFMPEQLISYSSEAFSPYSPDIFTKPANQSIPQFIRKNRAEMESCDLLIFLGIFSHFRFFAFQRWRPASILIIHNGNGYLNPMANLHLSTSSFLEFGKDLLRLGKYFLTLDFIFRHQFLKRFDYLHLTTGKLYAYPRKRSFHFCTSFPLVYFKENSITSQNDPISIVIPGAVNPRIRDFKSLEIALYQIRSRLNKYVEIIFLGKPLGKSGNLILQSFKKLQTDKLKITSYRDFIPQQEYESKLENASFLILPLPKYLKVGLFREEYGYSNISGTINDLIKFGKPAILSPHYILEKNLNSLIKRYKTSKELETLILDWIENQTFIPLYKQRAEILQDYQLRIVRKELSDIINDLIAQSRTT